MRVRIKICGVTGSRAVEAAVRAGADAIGFVFADSPRQVAPWEAADLSRDVPPFVARVAVFRHPDPAEVLRVVETVRPTAVQAEPTPELLERLAGRVPLLPVLHDEGEPLDPPDDVPAVLLEASGRGGRGERPDWGRAAALARRTRLVLAGGLDPDNVGEAIARVRPYGVDVSSGVERERGLKDVRLIEAFVRAVRRAEYELVPVAGQPADELLEAAARRRGDRGEG